jgi:alpha-L-rhamnosidase
VKLIPGELLDASGLVSQRSSGGPSYFSITRLRGSGEETWHPRFSYYGFRYVQVEGVSSLKPNGDAALSPRCLRSKDSSFIHPRKITGDFSSSDELLDRHSWIDRRGDAQQYAKCADRLSTS